MFKYKKLTLNLVTFFYIVIFIIELFEYLKVNSNIFGVFYLIFNLAIIFLLVPCAYNYKKYYSPARISKLIIIILLGIFASFVLDKITIKIDSSSEYINKIFIFKNVIKSVFYVALAIICILEFKVEKVIKSINTK